MSQQPHPTVDEIYSILLAHPEGLHIATLSKYCGIPVRLLSPRLRSMRTNGKVYSTGENIATIWHAQLGDPEWAGVDAPEYVKVSSIFRVGERFAAGVRV